MPLFADYLLKLTISLSIVWLFYQLALRRLTFYNWNRGYLIGYSALAFFMPFVNVAKALDSGPSGARAIMQYIPAIGNGGIDAVSRHAEIPGYFSRYSSWDLLFAILILGSSILLLRFSIRWVSLWRLRRHAVPIGDSGVKIYQVEGQIVPFSFGNAIYGNRRLHTDKEWEEIILHEYVHILQRHTLDILLAEWLCILNWYNPFAWLIRHSIRQNLEFIADSKVLENGCDKKGYQYHLLKVIGESRYRLANNFNFSSLKKRIIMMNKIKSARLQLVKFFFLLPVAAVLLLAFRGKLQSNTPGVMQEATVRTKSEATRGVIMDKVPIRDSIPSDMDASLNGPARPSTTTVRPVLVQHRDTLQKPLYFLDGVEIPELKNIDPMEIDHIDVMKKGDSLVGKYGQRGKNGAVFIYLKHPNSPDSLLVTADARKDSVPEIKTKARPAWEKTDRSSGIRVIDISIDSTRVTIIDKKDSIVARGSGAKVSGTTGFGHPELTSLRIADNFKGLILLDGKELSNAEFKSINPLMIKSYGILSGDDGFKRYGEKGRQGAIIVDSK